MKKNKQNKGETKNNTRTTKNKPKKKREKKEKPKICGRRTHLSKLQLNKNEVFSVVPRLLLVLPRELAAVFSMVICLYTAGAALKPI